MATAALAAHPPATAGTGAPGSPTFAMLDNIQTVGVMAGDDGRDDDDKTIEELTSAVLQGPDYLQSETDPWLDDFDASRVYGGLDTSTTAILGAVPPASSWPASSSPPVDASPTEPSPGDEPPAAEPTQPTPRATQPAEPLLRPPPRAPRDDEDHNDRGWAVNGRKRTALEAELAGIQEELDSQQHDVLHRSKSGARLSPKDSRESFNERERIEASVAARSGSSVLQSIGDELAPSKKRMLVNVVDNTVTFDGKVYGSAREASIAKSKLCLFLLISMYVPACAALLGALVTDTTDDGLCYFRQFPPHTHVENGT